MNTLDRRAFFTHLAGGIAAISSLPSAAHELRSVQIVVPAPPGSQPDLLARWLIDPIAKRAGVAGMVLNRPGAAGAIAADEVLAAAPEAGALLLGGLDHVAYSHLNSSRRPLDPLIDFVPVGAVNRDTWLVCTPAERSSRTLAGLVESSRKAPLSYASGGEGSTAHLLAARLCQALGIEAQHVPYKQVWLPDLLAGRIDFVVTPTPAMLAQIKAARVTALASLTDERLPVLENVPSIRELGWPDQIFYGGLFLFAPASLSAHAQQFNDGLVQTLQSPEIVQRYRDAGIEATPFDLGEVRQIVRERLRTVDAMRLAVFGRTR